MNKRNMVTSPLNTVVDVDVFKNFRHPDVYQIHRIEGADRILVASIFTDEDDARLVYNAMRAKYENVEFVSGFFENMYGNSLAIFERVM